MWPFWMTGTANESQIFSLIYTIAIGINTEDPLFCNTLFRLIGVDSQELCKIETVFISSYC